MQYPLMSIYNIDYFYRFLITNELPFDTKTLLNLKLYLQ